MNRELYINDILIDLDEVEDPIALTFAVNDIADLQDRQSTFSNTVKFAKTGNNIKVMGYATIDSVTQDEPYNLLSAKLVQNGTEILPNGLFTLIQITDNFEGQIISGIGGFASEISDKKLIDLDFTSLNHAYTDVNILASMSSIAGYIYPIIDYGTLPVSDMAVPYTSLMPAVYTKTLIDMIIKQAGYKYSGEVFSDPVLDREIIPFTNDNFGKVINGENVPYVRGDMVDMSTTVPDIKQADFLKDWMQRYCITPVVDNYQKTVVFRKFSELYKNKSKAIDWTNKFIDMDGIDEFTLGSYAQVNNALYKSDDLVTALYGNGLFMVNNKNLAGQVDIFTSVFAASLTVRKLNGVEMASIQKYDPNDPAVKNKTEPRVLISQNIPNPGITFEGRAPTIVNVAYFKKTGLPGLGYDELLNRNYQDLFKILDKARKATRYVNINEVDLAALDHFIPIYNARESKYYYINQIIDYIPNMPTQVELIRL